ncbi:MAG TPA: hypothetical protein VF533_21485 [Solirubrobacteraceae bacterium]|jgi:hypothetical protein
MNRRIGARTAGTLATVFALGALGAVGAVADPPEGKGKPDGVPTPAASPPADPGKPADPGASGEDHGAAGGDVLPGNSGETPAADRPEHPEHPEHPATPATGALPPAAPPAVGKQVKAGAVKGKVRVRLPGGDADVALEDAASLPVGTVIDAREGTVELTSAADADGTPQTARFRGGRFTVAQRAAASPVTELKLRGGSFATCPRAASARSGAVASASASGRKRKVRSLWGSGHGSFRTKGRHSAATVRGTIWEVVDRCDGTLTKVHRGVVAVRDFKRGKTVMVRAGHAYLSKPR